MKNIVDDFKDFFVDSKKYNIVNCEYLPEIITFVDNIQRSYVDGLILKLSVY